MSRRRRIALLARRLADMLYQEPPRPAMAARPKRGPLEGGRWRAWQPTRSPWRAKLRAVALGVGSWRTRKAEEPADE